MLDVELFGMAAGKHHLVNVLLHATSTALLFLFMARTTGAIWRSAAVAALFGVHPLHVESVAWVAERKDVLSSVFWMLTLLAYANYVRDPGFKRKVSVLVFLGLGLLSKPMLVTVPFTLLLLDYWPLKRLGPDAVMRASAWAPLLREKTSMFILVIASAMITVRAQRGGGAVIALDSLSLANRVGSALVAYVAYLRDTLWPARLAVFYPFAEPTALSVAGAALFVGLATFLAVRFGKSCPYIPVGWFWFAGTLVPVIGLVQVGAQSHADRYTYVPLIGIFTFVVWGLADVSSRWNRSRHPIIVATVLMISGCAVAAKRQVVVWRSDLSLWTHAVAVTTGNYRAENHLGVALTDRGSLEEGIRHYEAALTIWPHYPEAHNNLGTARVDQGRIDDAIHEFSEAARLKPASSTFHYNLAVVLSNRGDTAGALASLKRALSLNPNDPQYREALAALGGN